MSTAEYMKDESGQCFIPASQRPDGTWRKARRVKDGYVPQEEMPLYESKGKQWAKSRSEYPVGLAPDDVAAAKAKQEPNNAGIPGLVITPKPEKSKSKKKSGGGKKKSAAPDASLTKQLQETHISESTADKGNSLSRFNLYLDWASDCPKHKIFFTEKSKSKKKSGGGKKKSAAPDASLTKQLQETHISESTADKDQQAAPTDPVKRLRNLRKKLRDIEKLEKQINSGELKKPDEDQLLKVKKKGEVLKLIKELEKEVGESN
ncbi:partner of Y14 and mago-like [Macrobrachium nipponense]|uniref:partner of Y14 and mago-like n=1 Tax=Macrobrachium nipponense TaxID=159736 RepID=UPI0030C8A826